MWWLLYVLLVFACFIRRKKRYLLHLQYQKIIVLWRALSFHKTKRKIFCCWLAVDSIFFTKCYYSIFSHIGFHQSFYPTQPILYRPTSQPFSVTTATSSSMSAQYWLGGERLMKTDVREDWIVTFSEENAVNSNQHKKIFLFVCVNPKARAKADFLIVRLQFFFLMIKQANTQ